MALFTVAIIKKPTKKEIEDGTGEETLVLAPTPIIARDANTALIAAVMKSGNTEALDPNRCEVLVQPF